MKKYFIIDCKNGNYYISRPFDTEADAILFADNEWGRLCNNDKRASESYEVGYGEMDEYGELEIGMGYDVIKSYK